MACTAVETEPLGSHQSASGTRRPAPGCASMARNIDRRGTAALRDSTRRRPVITPH
ncbi:hypothetical protein ACFPRL_23005 [Pseudoclavibacter helvolus]